MALVIGGVLAAFICSFGALLLGASWWAIPLIYMGAGTTAVLAGAVWVWFCGPDAPKPGGRPDGSPMIVSGMQATQMQRLPVRDIAGG